MWSQSRSGHDLLARAEARRQSAWRVLERLDLVRRWTRYGEPIVVGSVALRVVVRTDIDMEIVTDEPRVEDGFAVVAECARIPGVLCGRYRNELVNGDPTLPSGVYWKLDYQADESPPHPPTSSTARIRVVSRMAERPVMNGIGPLPALPCGRGPPQLAWNATPRHAGREAPYRAGASHRPHQIPNMHLARAPLIQNLIRNAFLLSCFQ
jgi:hypothetical protein